MFAPRTTRRRAPSSAARIAVEYGRSAAGPCPAAIDAAATPASASMRPTAIPANALRTLTSDRQGRNVRRGALSLLLYISECESRPPRRRRARAPRPRPERARRPPPRRRAGRAGSAPRRAPPRRGRPRAPCARAARRRAAAGRSRRTARPDTGTPACRACEPRRARRTGASRRCAPTACRALRRARPWSGRFRPRDHSPRSESLRAHQTPAAHRPPGSAADRRRDRPVGKRRPRRRLGDGHGRALRGRARRRPGGRESVAGGRGGARAVRRSGRRSGPGRRRRRPVGSDRAHRPRGEGRRARRRKRRHERPPRVPARQRPESRLPQRALHGRDRRHLRRAAVSERVEGPLLGRATRIATVLAKHGLRERRSDEPLRERAKRLRAALEELGPTYAKLGQILSTRPDLLPPEVVDELSTLQDDVAPLSEAEVVQVMEEELGVPWEDVFESIDPQPLAAGTIGQVHKATLDSGERVIVKVQRPGARNQIMRDLGLLRIFAEKTESREALRRIVDLPAVVEHLSDSLQRELDFEQEAGNIERMREVLKPFSRLDAPAVHDRFTTKRLLVLELIPGGPVREAPLGPERKEAAAQLLEAFYRQILTDGFFHADPHPGNLLWSDGTIYFLDLGMVGEVAPEVRGRVLLLLLAFWQEDVPFLAEVLLTMAPELPDHVDMPAFERELADLLAQYRHASLGEIQLGPI